ncbi:hypothetical protein EV361DRAFT_961884 [Lentinula raphanica]|nr:hypothetical protein EV361DRAFT_961884 [Lentinula raphanica]
MGETLRHHVVGHFSFDWSTLTSTALFVSKCLDLCCLDHLLANLCRQSVKSTGSTPSQCPDFLSPFPVAKFCLHIMSLDKAQKSHLRTHLPEFFALCQEHNVHTKHDKKGLPVPVKDWLDKQPMQIYENSRSSIFSNLNLESGVVIKIHDFFKNQMRNLRNSASAPRGSSFTSPSSTNRVASTMVDHSDLPDMGLEDVSKIITRLLAPSTGKEIFLSENEELVQKEAEHIRKAGIITNNAGSFQKAWSDKWAEAEQSLYEQKARASQTDVGSSRQNFIRAIMTLLQSARDSGVLGSVGMTFHMGWAEPGGIEVKGYCMSPATAGEETYCNQDYLTEFGQFLAKYIPLPPLPLPKVDIPLNSNGLPVFPPLDLAKITPDELRAGLVQYLDAVWKYSFPATAIPFQQIEDCPDFYYDQSLHQLPKPLRHPELMSISEVYEFCEHLWKLGNEMPFMFYDKDLVLEKTEERARSAENTARAGEEIFSTPSTPASPILTSSYTPIAPPPVVPPQVVPSPVVPPQVVLPQVVQPSIVQPSVVQPPVVQPSDVQPSDVQPSDVQPSDVQPSDVQPSDVQPSDVQPSDVQPSDVQPSDVQPSDVQPSDVQPSVVQPQVVPPPVVPLQIVPPPLITPQVVPTPVVPPPVVPPPVVPPPVVPSPVVPPPVVTPQVVPLPVVTPPIVTPQVIPPPVVSPSIAPSQVIAPQVVPPPVVPSPIAPPQAVPPPISVLAPIVPAPISVPAPVIPIEAPSARETRTRNHKRSARGTVPPTLPTNPSPDNAPGAPVNSSAPKTRAQKNKGPALTATSVPEDAGLTTRRSTRSRAVKRPNPDLEADQPAAKKPRKKLKTYVDIITLASGQDVMVDENGEIEAYVTRNPEGDAILVDKNGEFKGKLPKKFN